MDKSSSKYRVIPLTQGKFAVVDAEDYDRLCGRKWHAAKNGGQFYAQRYEKRRNIAMHREILDIPPGMVCDHKNHNTLDNRKGNLRICTPAQNQYNQLPRDGGTSRYKGVRWHKDNCKWQAAIGYNSRLIHIGYYEYEADAAIAYDDMAIELFGEFACLNFHHRPEIRLWMEATYLFNPMRNELVSLSCCP
ncbi:MAG: HNH endonuclease [Sedimentisphaerales bacterium]|nr:HNH endonuclease [Sedimentisphaerales bacterium]